MPFINPFQENQYPETETTECLQVYIPASPEFKWLLAGLIRLAGSANNYQDPDSALALAHSQVWRDAYDLTDWEQCVSTQLPTISLFSINAVVSAGTLTYTQAAFMPFGYSMDSDTTANRNIRHPVWLPAGTFEYTWQYAKTTASGNADLLLTDTGGSVVETIDNNIDMWGLFNARFFTGGQFDVPADDFYQIRVANDGTKNASSSGFRVSSTSFHLRQIS